MAWRSVTLRGAQSARALYCAQVNEATRACVPMLRRNSALLRVPARALSQQEDPLKAAKSALSAKAFNPNDALVEAPSNADRPFSELTTAEKVVETGKTGGSVGVIVFGVGLACACFYYVAQQGWEELFGKSDPYTDIRNKALKQLGGDKRVAAYLGDSINVTIDAQHEPVDVKYTVGNQEFLRQKFHVQGSKQRGATVHQEFYRLVEGSADWTTRYFYVDVAESGMNPSQRVVLQEAAI